MPVWFRPSLVLCPRNNVQSTTLRDAGSVIPDLIRDRHDGQDLSVFSNYDTVCFAGVTIILQSSYRTQHDKLS